MNAIEGQADKHKTVLQQLWVRVPLNTLCLENLPDGVETDQYHKTRFSLPALLYVRYCFKSIIVTDI